MRAYSRWYVGSLLAFGVFAALVAGCGGGNNNDQRPQIRTFNAFVPAAGTAGPVAVTVNGTVIASNVQFGTFVPSNGFIRVNNGVFNPSVSGTGIVNPIQFAIPPNVSNNTQYFLVTAGQEGAIGPLAPQLFLLPVYNCNTNPVPAGQVAVRVVNLAPGLGATSLFTTSNGNTTLVNATLSNLDFGFNAVTNGFVFVPVGSLANLSLQTAANPGTNLVLTNSNLTTTNFIPGHAYTIFIVGTSGNVNQPLTAVVVQDC